MNTVENIIDMFHLSTSHVNLRFDILYSYDRIHNTWIVYC